MTSWCWAPNAHMPTAAVAGEEARARPGPRHHHGGPGRAVADLRAHRGGDVEEGQGPRRRVGGAPQPEGALDARPGRRRPARRRGPGWSRSRTGSRVPTVPSGARKPFAASAAAAAPLSSCGPELLSRLFRRPGDARPDGVRVVQLGPGRFQPDGHQRDGRSARVVGQHRLLRRRPRGGLVAAEDLQELAGARGLGHAAEGLHQGGQLLVAGGERLTEHHRGGQAGRLPTRLGDAELELSLAEQGLHPGHRQWRRPADLGRRRFGHGDDDRRAGDRAQVLEERSPVDDLDAVDPGDGVRDPDRRAGCPRSASARGPQPVSIARPAYTVRPLATVADDRPSTVSSTHSPPTCGSVAVQVAAISWTTSVSSGVVTTRMGNEPVQLAAPAETIRTVTAVTPSRARIATRTSDARPRDRMPPLRCRPDTLPPGPWCRGHDHRTGGAAHVGASVRNGRRIATPGDARTPSAGKSLRRVTKGLRSRRRMVGSPAAGPCRRPV